ncbi:MAG TPA: DALR domain-containing protein, partial [Nitrososphaera sp.]|nr:DALR domain-containing protein [Nitrososphaera sp.]
FPRHENEIAQSEAYTGKQFAKIWIHSGMVTINSQKMSKSLGNIVTIEQALARWGMNTLRLYCLSVHYAKPLDYNDGLLRESVQRWRQIETCAYELHSATGSGGEVDAVIKLCDESVGAFEAAMDDDMNTSLALTEFLNMVTRLSQYAASDRLTKDMADAALPCFNRIMDILGLRTVQAGEQERKEIDQMVAERNRLRSQKRFKEADELRKKLLERSIELLDHKDRTVWVKRERHELL